MSSKDKVTGLDEEDNPTTHVTHIDNSFLPIPKSVSYRIEGCILHGESLEDLLLAIKHHRKDEWIQQLASHESESGQPKNRIAS